MHKMTSISLKMVQIVIWVKIVGILSVAQLVTTIIFFSAWDKSRVKWDNSQNSTQKVRTNDRRLSKIKYALRDWHFRKTWIFYEKRGIPFWFDDHRTRIKSVEGIKFNYVNDGLVWKIILNNVECRLEQFFPLTMRNIAYKIKFRTMKIMVIRVVKFQVGV